MKVSHDNGMIFGQIIISNVNSFLWMTDQQYATQQQYYLDGATTPQTLSLFPTAISSAKYANPGTP